MHWLSPWAGGRGQGRASMFLEARQLCLSLCQAAHCILCPPISRQSLYRSRPRPASSLVPWRPCVGSLEFLFGAVVEVGRGMGGELRGKDPLSTVQFWKLQGPGGGDLCVCTALKPRITGLCLPEASQGVQVSVKSVGVPHLLCGGDPRGAMCTASPEVSLHVRFWICIHGGEGPFGPGCPVRYPIGAKGPLPLRLDPGRLQGSWLLGSCGPVCYPPPSPGT